MSHVALRMPTTTSTRLKTIAGLFAVSVVMLAGSPALATQTARHDVHDRFSEQKAGVYRHQTFGPYISREIDAPRWSGAHKTHDDWPANMILG
jgi:hypothetical protein